MFVYVLSFECYAILRTFECRGSLLWTIAEEVFIYVLRFIDSEVKMPYSCSPKAIQSRVRTRKCPCFGNESTSSRITTEQASFVSIYTVSSQYNTHTTAAGQLFVSKTVDAIFANL